MITFPIRVCLAFLGNIRAGTRTASADTDPSTALLTRRNDSHHLKSRSMASCVSAQSGEKFANVG